MKKLLIISIVLFIGINGFSQKVRFGLVGSGIVSFMKSDVKIVESSGAKMGFNYGLSLDFPFSDNVDFTTGILIENCGGKLTYNEGAVSFWTKDSVYVLDQTRPVMYKLQYLTIPLGLKLKTNEIGYITYFGQVGLTPSINIGAKGEVEGLIDNQKINEGFTKRDEVNFGNLGYHIGAGIEYSLSGNTSFLAALYYNNGFVDVTTSPKDKIILNNVSLKVGILF